LDLRSQPTDPCISFTLPGAARFDSSLLSSGTHAARAQRGRWNEERTRSKMSAGSRQTLFVRERGKEAARRSERSPHAGVSHQRLRHPTKNRSAGAAGAQHGQVVCSGKWCWVRENGEGRKQGTYAPMRDAPTSGDRTVDTAQIPTRTAMSATKKSTRQRNRNAAANVTILPYDSLYSSQLSEGETTQASSLLNTIEPT